MISIIFKCSIAFIFSFLVLSLPISKKPLFYHLTELTGPIGSDLKNSFSKSMKRSVSKTKKLGTELFSNATPPAVEDKVRRKQSAILTKRRQRIKRQNRVSEELRHKEKKALDNIIGD